MYNLRCSCTRESADMVLNLLCKTWQPLLLLFTYLFWQPLLLLVFFFVFDSLFVFYEVFFLMGRYFFKFFLRGCSSHWYCFAFTRHLEGKWLWYQTSMQNQTTDAGKVVCRLGWPGRDTKRKPLFGVRATVWPLLRLCYDTPSEKFIKLK